VSDLLKLPAANKPINRFCLSCFLSLFLCALFLFCGQALAQKPDQLARVGVSKVQVLPETNKIELPGNVLPWATSRLAAEVEGRVEKIVAGEGQSVAEGDPLIYLRTQPQKLELELAEAEREMTANRLEELTAGTRPEVIEAANAATKNAEAALKLTQVELNRIQKLFKEGVLSGNDYDNASTAADRARAARDEKKAKWDELVAGPRIEEIKQQEARLSAAEVKIKFIQDNIDRSVIRSPFNGFIIEKLTEVGQWLEKGDPGMTMIATDPVKVEVHVPQHHFYRVGKGIKVKVILESRQDSVPDHVFQGKVIEIIPFGNSASRTFPVRIQVDNPKSILAAGMLVKVIYQPEKTSSKQIYVPKDALVRSPDEAVVWVVRPEQGKGMKAHKVIVTAGEQKNSMIAINPKGDKIKAGEWVVVQGNERLRPGISIEIIKELP
jgi:HlyD family secretion protein